MSHLRSHWELRVNLGPEPRFLVLWMHSGPGLGWALLLTSCLVSDFRRAEGDASEARPPYAPSHPYWRSFKLGRGLAVSLVARAKAGTSAAENESKLHQLLQPPRPKPRA